MAFWLTLLLNCLTQFIPRIGAWYSASPTLRFQTDAFLRGHMALGFSPYDLPWDCVWDHGIQEVWGLGVPAFRLIFEMAARLCGERFPDRVTFLIGSCLCYCFLLSTFAKSQNASESVRGFGKGINAIRIVCVLAILVFAPPFVVLLRTRFVAYEEVVAYGYLYALILFAGLLRVAAKTKTPGLLLLSVWAGIGVWIRPTLLFYGVVTVTLALGIGWRARMRPRTLACMLLLFCLPGALQAYTNFNRFGGWAEFGHKLNLDDIIDNNFALKFDYPFHREPLFSAVSDEVGTLFCVREMNGLDWYKRGGILGQSPTYRWREMYFTTYDCVYLGLLVASVLFWLRFKYFRGSRVKASNLEPAFQREGHLVACSFSSLAVPWGALSFMCLFGFYLWSPSASSRYNVDFLAAIMIIISAFVWNLFEWNLMPVKISAAVIGVATIFWLAFEITHSKIVKGFRQYPPIEAVQVEAQTPMPEAVKFPPPLRHYRLGQFDLTRGLPFNCTGWDLKNGSVHSAVVLFASDPQCVILSISAPPQKNITPEDIAPIQAKIGLEYLVREGVTINHDKAVLVFHGPRRARYQKGVQVCFLGFIRAEEMCRKEPGLLLTDVSFEPNNSESANSDSSVKE